MSSKPACSRAELSNLKKKKKRKKEACLVSEEKQKQKQKQKDRRQAGRQAGRHGIESLYPDLEACR